MPTITYTAVDRGELMSGHSDDTEYQFQFELEAYPRTRSARGTMEQTNNGQPEGWLAAQLISWALVTDRVFEANVPQWEEFFSSVINGEAFEIDLVGTIASPSSANTYSVWMPTRTIERQQLLPRDAQYTFAVQKLP